MESFFKKLNDTINKLSNQSDYEVYPLSKRELTIISSSLFDKSERSADQMEDEEIVDLIVKLQHQLEEYND